VSGSCARGVPVLLLAAQLPALRPACCPTQPASPGMISNTQASSPLDSSSCALPLRERFAVGTWKLSACFPSCCSTSCSNTTLLDLPPLL
jgi:hypothetical protein